MSTNGRKKKVILKDDISREEADTLLGEYSDANSKFKQLTAQMELEINNVRDKFQGRLDDQQATMEEKFEQLDHFGKTHPEYFAERKSIEFTHGVIGFRTGTPKLKLLKGFKWENVLANVKRLLPEFIREKSEVDKEGLLNNANVKEISSKFDKIGVCVEQDETFFVKPKEELAIA